MVKPKNLHLDVPQCVRTLLKMNLTQDIKHPQIFEATDPEDIIQRRLTDEIGIKVVRDFATGRYYLMGFGLKNRHTTMSGMGFEPRPDVAIIYYAELKPGQVRLYEAKERAARSQRL